MDHLDKEPEKRGPRFVYSIENRLRLKVKPEKNVVSNPLAGGFNPSGGFDKIGLSPPGSRSD